MKNYRNITPIEAIGIGTQLIELLIKGFENIGFRKSIKKDVETLKELAITQNKRIEELEKQVYK